jgi:hypothetical protein
MDGCLITSQSTQKIQKSWLKSKPGYLHQTQIANLAKGFSEGLGLATIPCYLTILALLNLGLTITWKLSGAPISAIFVSYPNTKLKIFQKE